MLGFRVETVFYFQSVIVFYTYSSKISGPVVLFSTTHLGPSATPSCPCVRTQVVDRIPAQRTSVLVTALEPLIETGAMEQILAGLASLVRHLLVATDNAIANGTFTLAFESANDVASKGSEPIYYAAALFCAC
jgi:hypothetical protein